MDDFDLSYYRRRIGGDEEFAQVVYDKLVSPLERAFSTLGTRLSAGNSYR